MVRYRPRLVDTLLEEYLSELPAVMIVGPRACGKTTTAARHATSMIRLDTDRGAAAFRAGPDAALRGRAEPLLLDEWQMAPSVMGAVKRSIDTDRRPGRFLITGSVGSGAAAHLWPGTGRVVTLNMYPLTVAEQRERPTRPLVDRLVLGRSPEVGDDPDLRDYLELAVSGGFPEPALQLGSRTARAWLESYADQVALRDAPAGGAMVNAVRLRRYLEAYALNSAGAAHDKTLYDAAGVSRKTALTYEQRLHDLAVVDQLPAWSTNRLKRLSRTAKRYIVDSGLLAGILRLGLDDVLADGALIGRFIETFVVAQLRAEAVAARSRYRLAHLRDQNGRREVDVIAELGGGRIIGIEIKASGKIGRADARHLEWLRDAMGDRFVAGLVMHTGQDTFGLSERIAAAPISTLWS